MVKIERVFAMLAGWREKDLQNSAPPRYCPSGKRLMGKDGPTATPCAAHINNCERCLTALEGEKEAVLN